MTITPPLGSHRGAGTEGNGEGSGAAQTVHTAPSVRTLLEQDSGKTNRNYAGDGTKTSSRFHLAAVDHPARVSVRRVNIVVWFRSAPRRRSCCLW